MPVNDAAEGWNAMDKMPDAQLCHIGLYAFDLETMVDFYSRVFGLTVTDRGHSKRGFDIAFLSRDPAEHHQIAIAAGRPKDAVHSTVNQISFRVPDLAALRGFRVDSYADAIAKANASEYGLSAAIVTRTENTDSFLSRRARSGAAIRARSGRRTARGDLRRSDVRAGRRDGGCDRRAARRHRPRRAAGRAAQPRRRAPPRRRQRRQRQAQSGAKAYAGTGP